MKTNSLFVCIGLTLAMVSCRNGHTNSDVVDTTDYCVDCLEEEAGTGYGGSATIKANAALPEKYYNTEWIKAYSKFILDSVDTSAYKEFVICNIDNDEMPELCLYGRCFAEGAMILSQHKGIVTRYWSYWSPQYIERSGLIDNGYAHTGTYGDYIVKLEDGVFKEILHTEAVWHDIDDHYFVYLINEKVVDTIHGENANEESCLLVNNAFQRPYSTQGNSIPIYDSPQGVYYTKSLYNRSNPQLTNTWIKYDNLVGGYEVLLHCKQQEEGSSFFTTDFYLTKKGKTLTFRQTVSFDKWEPWCLEGLTETDTQYIHNTHKTSITQKIDWHNLLYFEDMDFDGEDELVVCGYVRPQRRYADELDCEDFTIYKIIKNRIRRIKNVPFDELTEGLCRTGFHFDKKNKCLVFTGYSSFYLTIKEKYWFKNGQVYMMDYDIIDKDKGKKHYHWGISGVESGEIIKRMDSIRKQGNYY